MFDTKTLTVTEAQRNTQLLPLLDGPLVDLVQLDGDGCLQLFTVVYVVSDEIVIPPDGRPAADAIPHQATVRAVNAAQLQEDGLQQPGDIWRLWRTPSGR